MTTITSDFSGTYDYPAEEAVAEAFFWRDAHSDYTADELNTQAEKLRAHWTKAFGDDDQGREDMARFVQVFNSAKAGFTI